MRLKSIICNWIYAHSNARIEFLEIENKNLHRQLNQLLAHYENQMADCMVRAKVMIANEIAAYRAIAISLEENERRHDYWRNYDA